MRSWAELRSEIRYQLKDTGSSPRWSNDELKIYVNYALLDYSRYFPKEREVVISLSLDGSATPPGTVFAVEYPDGVFLNKVPVKPGSRLWDTAVGWYILDEKLWVVHPDKPSSVTVHYYDHRDRVTEDSSIVDVPVEDEELIVLYVLAKCTERVGEQAAVVDRWKDGRRDDSPLSPMMNHYYQRYLNGITQRMSGRSLQVKYVRRRGGDLRSRVY